MACLHQLAPQHVSVYAPPLDAAMLLADVVGSPLNIGAVLILFSPARAGQGYVDQFHAKNSPEESHSIHDYAGTHTEAWIRAASGAVNKQITSI